MSHRMVPKQRVCRVWNTFAASASPRMQQHLHFEFDDEPPATQVTGKCNKTPTQMLHINAESLGLTLTEIFQSGIGRMALEFMVGGSGSRVVCIDLFSDIVEVFSETLLSPSRPLLNNGCSGIKVVFYMMHTAHALAVCWISFLGDGDDYILPVEIQMRFIKVAF